MRLLFGSDPGSLVVRCLTELHRLTVDFPDQRAFLIVPETIKVQMERAYLDTTGTAGLMMAEVLSFRRLAHRLLDETGLLPNRRVDAFGPPHAAVPRAQGESRTDAFLWPSCRPQRFPGGSRRHGGRPSSAMASALTSCVKPLAPAPKSRWPTSASIWPHCWRVTIRRWSSTTSPIRTMTWSVWPNCLKAWPMCHGLTAGACHFRTTDCIQWPKAMSTSVASALPAISRRRNTASCLACSIWAFR